ncbi:MAG: carbamate kinase [Candidatus Diapherotrites archaeon CG08_land_8_20_14_0_20_34_12]|nr:MAG: carbamate kinase [Candidatus Diapherotrites archaeon CG08_land_8_20_14_0_20_34_12]
MNDKIVLALGGNALIRKGQYGTVYEQFANTRAAVEGILPLLKKGYKLAITHGNGPQVGNIMIRTEAALDKAYYIPLGVAVAESQGEIGYMIEQTLQNKLKQHGINRKIVCILTQVICDKEDSNIINPSKPIGPFYTKEQVEKIKTKENTEKMVFIEDSGRGFRRVVPSPIPKDIVEKETINELVDKGIIPIVCGGGGMPVYYEKDGCLEGIDGVVDKDRASALLASQIGADQLIILTGVEKVCLNFNTPQQKPLDKVTVKEAKDYLKQGHFPAGSMGPKIEAAIDFLEKGGKQVIITSIDKLMQAVEGKAGTHIIGK